MIVFWIAAAMLAAGAAALIMSRSARARSAVRRTDPAMAVYRRALGEIDRLGERDLLAEDEGRAMRAEAARRLLSAAEAPAAPPAAASGGLPILLAAGAVALAAAGLYMVVGSPGMADQPFAGRLAAWQAHPETAPPAGLAAVLASIAAARPADATPLRKLAALDLEIGDADGAAHALRRAMMVAPDAADIPAMLGEIRMLQNNGAMTPAARALFVRAAGLDPTEATARYYLAKARIADGDVSGGLAAWESLLASLSPADPRRAMLVADIGEVRASGRLAPPVTPPPPPAEMTAAILGMVDGLAARLASHPDDPAGWVRLVRAYGVLGQTDRRDEALAQARARYAGRPDELAALAAAAAVAPSPPGGGL